MKSGSKTNSWDIPSPWNLLIRLKDGRVGLGFKHGRTYTTVGPGFYIDNLKRSELRDCIPLAKILTP